MNTAISSSSADVGSTPSSPAAIPEECSVFPASFAQERLWFLDQLEPDSPAYNMTFALRLKGELNVAALQQALAAVVKRHEPLRTTFVLLDQQPAQVIAPSLTVEMALTDLCVLPPEEREKEAARLGREEARRRFNLSRDLMLRARLLRLHSREHILFLSIHHIAFDGWSVGVLFGDLTKLYAALAEGKPPSLPALTIQYADFAVWQRQWLQGEVLDQHINYWKTQLKGAPTAVELPTDRPRPRLQTFHGASHTAHLTGVDALKKLSQTENATLYMTLLAAFKTLLFRYSGQEDLIVGSPVAGRNQSDTELLIGFFVNTLVLRSEISGDFTFRKFLRQVREVALGAFAHQDVPFELLVAQLQPDRNPSRSVLFNILFALQNTPEEKLNLPGVSLHMEQLSADTAKFDLSLFMWEDEEGLGAYFEYNTDLYEAATIQRMAGHFQTLLRGIVMNPDEQLSRLPLLPATEGSRLLREFNATEMDYDQDACLHHLFEAQAARTPDAIAVVAEQRLTYAELNQHANKLARHLRSLGVAADTLVGICVERSLQMVISMLAVLKAGGAYVPLDPAYPRERLSDMISDAQMPVIIMQKELMSALPPSNARIICCGEPSNSGNAAHNLSQNATSDSRAYVIYTSGSTGKPKGVQIKHRSVVNLLTSLAQTVHATEQDNLLAVTTFCFDISVLEIFLPLVIGARITLASREATADPRQLMNLIESSRPTIMQATPATWRLLVEAGWKGRKQFRVLCGGEALSGQLAEELLTRADEAWNVYGPTETTIWSTAWKIQPDANTISIGRPLANTQLYILDQALCPLPVGVVGELYIGGDGVALGYLHRPELTTEKFIPNPHRKSNDCIYRTGDLARYLPDGTVECLGRIDHQVKIRGFRIELGEIESVIRQNQNVKDAVVVARDDGEKRLIAYVVGQAANLPSELRREIELRLPKYMMPSAFVLLDALPLTPNGKVNRKALPAPSAEMETKQFLPPRDILEKQLAELWKKVFGMERIGIDDNFFELGGHSLLAVRLFAQIAKTMGKNLPLVTLFQAPTIEGLANILRQQGWEAPWSSLVPIKAGGSRPPFYCVHGVGGNILEFLDLAKYMDPDQPFYGLQAVGLDGKKPWLETTAEMAAHYIKEIRAFQPDGPYFLGGSSFGGLIAYEMAQQLRAQGESVSLLALFDTHAPGFPQRLPGPSPWRSRWDDFVYRLSLHGGNLKAAGRGRERVSYVWTKIKKWSRGRVILAKRLQTKWRARLDELFWPKPIRAVNRAGVRAWTRYAAVHYPGGATLFRATVQPKGICESRTLGWDQYVQGPLKIYDTPGHHGSIVRDPRAKVLAAQLNESLQKAQAGEEDNAPPSASHPRD